MAILMLATACNRNTGGMDYTLEGQMMTTPSLTPVPGADWHLFERAVVDGALQAEDVVASAESDEAGAFSVTFPRRSSYSLRWTAAAEGHFDAAGTLNPDELLPNVTESLTVPLFPVCTLHVNLSSIAPQDSTDVITFNLGEDFPCACCPTDALTLSGVDADSSWQCLMFGDAWMTWGADLDVALIGQPEGLFMDSVFCPAFGSAELNITW
jgi:hypothetical protein